MRGPATTQPHARAECPRGGVSWSSWIGASRSLKGFTIKTRGNPAVDPPSPPQQVGMSRMFSSSCSLRPTPSRSSRLPYCPCVTQQVHAAWPPHPAPGFEALSAGPDVQGGLPEDRPLAASASPGQTGHPADGAYTKTGFSERVRAALCVACHVRGAQKATRSHGPRLQRAPFWKERVAREQVELFPKEGMTPVFNAFLSLSGLVTQD